MVEYKSYQEITKTPHKRLEMNTPIFAFVKDWTQMKYLNKY